MLKYKLPSKHIPEENAYDESEEQSRIVETQKSMLNRGSSKNLTVYDSRNPSALNKSHKSGATGNTSIPNNYMISSTPSEMK